ncbi:hypothetical protein O0L34_g10355 [Tuta absoluta]|nr:hypothetical protein O0L34_g10355 [Tuta absoluta]
MSSPKQETEEPTSTNDVAKAEPAEIVAEAKESGTTAEVAKPAEPRPPAKRPAPVIEISDTESDDSDICAVTSYQATADEVKRIRGADYSSSSSSSSSDSYSSDSESPWEDDSILLDDEKPASKVLRSQLYPRANRTDDPILNSSLKSQELIERLTTHWNESKDLSTEEVTLTSEPFRLCLLHDLLSNEAIINNIVDDMNTLDWTRKKMDLYEFHQTVDLANLTWQRSIKGIYELLKTEVMSWVSKITGLELQSVSASCSLYGPGDHLLVHDDMLSDRRVAFILYLAPWRPPAPPPNIHNGDSTHNNIEQVDLECHGWAEHMGGALELLAKDELGQPTTVAHKVYPRNNMLAFFQVGTETFHQVGEVLSLELPRLSINGWFHGPPPPGHAEPPPQGTPPAARHRQAA